MPGENPETAEAKAELWLRQNNYVTLPVDPFAIAESLDITVMPKADCDPGVSGMLLRHGDTFGILYATNIKSPGFQRFSIAHELGHYLLEGHPEQLFPEGTSIHQSRAGFVSFDQHEREADHFASGLLMPDNLFKSLLRRCSEGLEGVEELAEKCLTSVTATAIRYAKKTQIPAAVIVSTDGRIDYAFLSSEMKEFPGIAWPKKGDRLPVRSITAAFASDRTSRGANQRGSTTVELNTWLGGRRNIDAKEDVLCLGGYGKILTVITTDYLPDEPDEDADLEESWTPRFRR